MLNSNRYLDAFARIEKHLRTKTRRPKSTTFPVLLEEAGNADAVVRRYEADLREFADLRNAIVHDRRDGCAIAEPHDSVVAEIEYMANSLVMPPKVYPEFAAEVVSASPHDSIGQAVEAMAHHKFSQLPICGPDGFVGLLSTNTVAMWLGANVCEDIVSLRDTSIEDVLEYAEDAENYRFVAKTTSLVEVLQSFCDCQARGNRLDAVIITETGSRSQSILGIITVWDLPQISRLTDPIGR